MPCTKGCRGIALCRGTSASLSLNSVSGVFRRSWVKVRVSYCVTLLFPLEISHPPTVPSVLQTLRDKGVCIPASPVPVAILGEDVRPLTQNVWNSVLRPWSENDIRVVPGSDTASGGCCAHLARSYGWITSVHGRLQSVAGLIRTTVLDQARFASELRLGLSEAIDKSDK